MHLKTINIFLSKVETTFNLDDVTDIQIVLKGVKRGNSDTSRYYIRLTFKEKNKIEFGKSTTFNSIKEKVH